MRPTRTASGLVLLVACAGTTPASTEERPTVSPPQPPTVDRSSLDAGAKAPPRTGLGPPELKLTLWTDMPAQVHRVGETTLASSKGDLAILRGGRIEQDARLTRVPNCTKRDEDVAGAITSVAGRWPDAAFMTRLSEDRDRPGVWLYRWKGNAWTVVRRVEDPQARLIGGSKMVVLARHDVAARGYHLDRLSAKAPTPTVSASGSCSTQLADLGQAVASPNGEMLAWGTGCDGLATLERFPPTGAPAITTWDQGEISVAGFSIAGEPMAALATGELGRSDVVVAREGQWTSTGSLAGHVRQLVGAEGATFALSEDAAGMTLWTFDGSWTQQRTAEGVGRVDGLYGFGEQLWLSSEAGLFSTRAPAGVTWEWFRRGCTLPTFARAKPYRNDPRRGVQNCAGEAFVLIGDTSDDTPPPSWVALYQGLGPAIDNGWLQQQGRRSQANRPTFGGETEIPPGFMITPVVSREMQQRYFGFRVSGGRDLIYQSMQTIQGAWERGPTPGEQLRWLCIDPVGYPEAQVRALGRRR